MEEYKLDSFDKFLSDSLYNIFKKSVLESPEYAPLIYMIYDERNKKGDQLIIELFKDVFARRFLEISEPYECSIELNL